MTGIRARIQKLRELHSKTTPVGDWKMEYWWRSTDLNEENEEFLIEAHNIVPRLMAYIERLERVATLVPVMQEIEDRDAEASGAGEV